MKHLPKTEEISLILRFAKALTDCREQGKIESANHIEGIIEGYMIGCGISDLHTVLDDRQKLSIKLMNGTIKIPDIDNEDDCDIKNVVNDLFKESKEDGSEV